MLFSSIETAWNLFIIMAVLLMLAVSIISVMVIHGRQMKESEHRFRLLFNQIIDGIILIDTKGIIVDINEPACGMLGYSKREISGRPFEKLIPIEGRVKLFLEFNKIINGSLLYLHGINLISKNGSEIQVELGCSRIRMDNHIYILGSFRDISERKRVEDALRESEERHRAVCEHSPVGICLTDEDGIYHYVNPAYCKIYGYTEEELIGQSYYELIKKPGNSEARRRRHKQRFKDGKPIEIGEAEFAKKSGELVWIQYAGDFIRMDNKPKCMVALNIDVTEQKKTQQALDEERLNLQEKNATLKEVLLHLEDEKLKIRKEAADTSNRVLMPALQKLVNDDKTVNMRFYNLLKSSLNELGAANEGMRYAFSKLTPREIEICSLIKNGTTSKEISKTLNLSLMTINKHRQRIRKKLVISNKNINLTSYLRNLK